jgi:RHS repeat-associated protein
MKMRSLLPVLPLSLLVAGTALAQQHPNLARGFSADKAYDSGLVDSVDLFSGGLNLSIPIGSTYPVNASLSYGLALYYNSKVWDYEEAWTNNVLYLQALPDRSSNAGLGFRLSLGELLSPSSPLNETARWVYVSADGGQHTFYDRLHAGESTTAGVCYTRDNSYLRLKGVGGCLNNSNGTLAEIEFPDGAIHKFTRASTAVPFKLASIRDRFSNTITITYLTGPVRWQITDGSRTQTVYFTSSPSWGNQVVDKVDLAAPGAGVGTYRFTYTDTAIYRSGDDNDPNTDDDTGTPGDQARVTFLSSVVLPDGSSYTMPSYETTTQFNPDGGPDAPGVLKKLILPTLGQIEWSYQAYEFVQFGLYEPDARLWHDGIGLSTGVKTKKVMDAAGNCYGGSCIWTYVPTVGVSPSYERKVVVTSPLGDDTVHWFVDNQAWDYGLPLRKSSTDGASRYLSQEIYDGSVAGGIKKRSVYLRFEADADDAQYGSGYNLDRRPASQRSTFHDDGNRWKAVDYSNFDSVGHYRQADTSGNFDSANAHSSYTGFLGGVPAASSPWLLNLVWDHTETEGASGVRDLNCMDASTGVLYRRRILKSTGTLSGSDVMVEYVRDAVGNVVSERYYGGDTQPTLSTADTCGYALAGPAYRIDNTYQYGSLKTSQHFGAGFFDVDYDLDANTGLPTTSRDTALASTTYQYDSMNRLTWVKPAQDAWVNYVYNRAQGTGVATVKVRHYPNGSVTGQLTDEEYEFDAFGRISREKHRTPSGTWVKRTSFYNGMGWKTNLSEWQQDGIPHTALTNYVNFDPFGRPAVIRPPDGSAHDVTLSYSGIRAVTRTTTIATGATGGEASSATTETYDGQGRLLKVQEPSGTAGANVTTTYSYDAAGHLIQASTPSGSTQNRYFTYDPRGFLTRECHPEKGASGNGCVTYSEFDARGHAHHKIDGPHDLGLSYDAAERVTLIDVYGTTTHFKVFTYGTGVSAADRSRGKVKTAQRYNYVGAPFNATVLITDSYTYGGDQGRVSIKDTSETFQGVLKETFRQTYAWNDLGDLASQTYPDCIAYCSPSTPRSVSYTYTDGRVTAVPGFATSITYYLNGMVNTVAHSNGVVFTQALDSSGMARPLSFSAAKGSSLWSSGAYAYDGAGNVKQIGTGYFQYDGVSRLLSGTVNASATGSLPRTQSASYDAFGNIQTLTTNGTLQNTPTSGATNHLSSGLYDDAGNLTTFNGATYQYDGLDSLKRMTNGGEDWIYIYDADDERFWSYRVGGGGSIWTLRGLDGKVLRNYDAHVSWSTFEDYIYREGQLLAGFQTSGVQRHFDLDHLGTPRLITDASGVGTYHAYYPFGQEATAFNLDTEKMKFTGHERDLANAGSAADDLDYMHARHACPLTGRFMSLDNGPVDMKRPQNWNRYAYVQNNPSNWTDPTGNVVDLSPLSPGQRARLFASLAALTGDIYESDKNNLLGVASYGDKGSRTASLFVRELIAATQSWVVAPQNGNPGFNFGGRVEGRREIWLDFSDLAQLDYGKVPSATFAAGSIFIHEALHTFGLSDPERAFDSQQLGQIEEVLNVMREEAGLPVHTGGYRPEVLGERSRMEFTNAGGQKSYIYFPTNLEKR